MDNLLTACGLWCYDSGMGSTRAKRGPLTPWQLVVDDRHPSLGRWCTWECRFRDGALADCGMTVLAVGSRPTPVVHFRDGNGSIHYVDKRYQLTKNLDRRHRWQHVTQAKRAARIAAANLVLDAHGWGA